MAWCHVSSPLLAFLRAVALLCACGGIVHAADDDICCDAAAGACLSHPHAYTGLKVALLFGVGEYSGKLTALPNAVNDARDFAAILSKNGFSVRCVRNAKRKEALGELKHLAGYVFPQDASPAEQADDTRMIIYFAGHGFQLKGTDYFFFLTDKQFANEADVQDAALSRREIFDEFAGLEKFEPHYIFDACRALFNFTFSDNPVAVVRGAFPSTDIDTHNPRNVGGYYVIHSTTKNGVALDSSPENHITSNGVFMARFKEQVGFPDLPLLAAVQFTARDLQLMGVASVPAQEGAGQVFQNTLSIRRHSSQCEQTAGDIWLETSPCKSLDKACTLKRICGSVKTADAANATCLTSMLKERLGYDPVAECRGVPVADPIIRTQVPKFASPALTATRNFTATVASLQSVANRDGVVAQSAPLLSGQRITPAIEQAVRAALLPPKDAVKASTVGAQTFHQVVEMRSIPSEKGRTIDLLTAGAPVTLNCGDTACTKQWSAVTANVDKKVIRGWIASSQLVPALELRYAGDALYPTRSDLNALRLRLKSTVPRSSLRLTAVQRKGAPDLAESRLVRLKGLIADLGVPEDKIERRIVVADSLDGDPFVEVQFGQPVSTDNLPVAYQAQPNR
jgi:hypothetical protein